MVAGGLCRHSQSRGEHAEPLYSHSSSPSTRQENRLRDPHHHPAPSHPVRQPAPSQSVGQGSPFALSARLTGAKDEAPAQAASMVWAASAPAAIALCLRELHLVPQKLTLSREPLPPPRTGDAPACSAFHSQPAPCTLPRAPVGIRRQWEFFLAAAITALEICTDRFPGADLSLFVF